jgi:hypothetical protein
MSGHVSSAMSEQGVVENVGVAVDISFVVVIQAELELACYVEFKDFRFPAAISDFWKVTKFESAIL